MKSTGSTRVFALLGDPVAHSLSPAMQNAAFRVMGINATYVPLRCAAEDLPALMSALVRAGGGGNVTIPHKTAAARAVNRPSALVRAIDACNTFWSDGADGPLLGDNTDIEGIGAALDRLAAPAGAWLLAGTGGSSRAVAAAARERGVALAVSSRDTSRGLEFSRWAERTLGVRMAEPAECRVLVNATPLGLAAGDRDPISPDAAPRAEVALDLVYAKGETAWVRRCRSRGLRAADGREVLVRQGAAAFSRWFPTRHAPVEVMRAAVHAALG